MSSSSFNVIRRHSLDATNVRLKELTQELAKQRSDIAGSQLETDDVRSQGRMDHSTIKVNDERLKFVTKLNNADPDFNYEFPNEPDHNFLKVWFMLDHLGARMRDMSGFGNDAYISGHPTLRRVGLDLGFQQTALGGGTSATPVMLFNSGTDVVSQKNGEYIWIPDNPSVQFIRFSAGFSITCRFSALSFYYHVPDPSEPDELYYRRIASKADDPQNGWNLVVYPTNSDGSQGAVQFEITDNGVKYVRKATGYSTGSFYQLVITYNPNAGSTSAARIKMYTAGIENSSDNTGVTNLPPYTNLRIGSSSGVSGFFYGYIHDFRLYMGKVLTQTETTNINQNELTIDNITKNHVFVVQYAFVSTLMRIRTHKFNIGGTVDIDKTHKFSILAKITRARIHKYSLIQSLTRARTHKYNINILVSRTRTHKYNLGGVVSLVKTHKYNITAKLETTRTHKYYVGGLQSQYKRFQKSVTVGSDIIQDIVFNGKPQAIIVWSDDSISDNTFTNDLVLNYGFSDGIHNACITAVSEDGVATSDTFSGIKDDKVISFSSHTAVGTMTAEATASFIDTNTVRFTWTTNDSRAVYIHCLALWGFNNAEVKTFTTGTAATGSNQTYSLNKTHMVPTIINTINNSAPLGWSTSYGVAPAIGMATSSSKQYSVGMVSRDAQASSDVTSHYDTTKVLMGLNDDSTTAPVEALGSLVSFQSGSFTINWTDAPVSSSSAFAALVLDAPNVDVGTFAQPITTPQTQAVNTATNVDTVKSVMLITNSQSTNASFPTIAAMGIGGGSGTGATDQGLIVTRENDAAATMESVSLNKTGTIAKTIQANATAASSTTTTEGALSALGTDQFTINWTTLDATARNFFYMVFGNT